MNPRFAATFFFLCRNIRTRTQAFLLLRLGNYIQLDTLLWTRDRPVHLQCRWRVIVYKGWSVEIVAEDQKRKMFRRKFDRFYTSSNTQLTIIILYYIILYYIILYLDKYEA